MNDKFQSIDPKQINENPFKLIDKDWMLITAGTKEHFNTMTASWGGFGILWHKQIAICFIRPQRYTYEFIEKSDYFTLSFFSEDYRKALTYCGTFSGRNVDKVAETGLVPYVTHHGNIVFEQAELIIETRKIYYDDLKPDLFLVRDIEKNYPKKDYHRMYIGEIIGCWTAKSP